MSPDPLSQLKEELKNNLSITISQVSADVKTSPRDGSLLSASFEHKITLKLGNDELTSSSFTITL